MDTGCREVTNGLDIEWKKIVGGILVVQTTAVFLYSREATWAGDNAMGLVAIVPTMVIAWIWW